MSFPAFCLPQRAHSYSQLQINPPKTVLISLLPLLKYQNSSSPAELTSTVCVQSPLWNLPSRLILQSAFLDPPCMFLPSATLTPLGWHLLHEISPDCSKQMQLLISLSAPPQVFCLQLYSVYFLYLVWCHMGTFLLLDHNLLLQDRDSASSFFSFSLMSREWTWVWGQHVTESKLILLTPWQANKSRDKLLGQGKWETLFRKPADQEDGGLVFRRNILPGFGC